eukprot:13292902-Ditylum_brightwellii.AAC.2
MSMRSTEFGGRGVNKKQMLMRAAEAMNMEHGTMMMTQYLVHLKQQDPRTMRQVREKIDV